MDVVSFVEVQSELKESDLGLFLTLELVSKISLKREELGMSQRALSKLSNIPQKTISRIENGLDRPKIATLTKLAEALGYSIEFSLIEI
jgi:transcriptional regulator with XRE-family HTH domain